MNKTTGIITHFYNSKNYGGLLQSYALACFLNKQLSVSEQICYKHNLIKFLGNESVITKKSIFRYLNIKKIFNRFLRVIDKIRMNSAFIAESQRLLLRNQSFEKFYPYIPHSKNVFNQDNLKDSINDYCIFITGSDQVWNMAWFDPNYFLEFVPNDKKKISYAASLGNNVLAEEEKEYFKKILPTFDAISVREKEMVDLLQPLVPNKKVEWVVDPTLLLEREEWDKICPERRVKEQYLFCYFLGHDKRLRKLAKKYAKNHNLKIVNLPHLCGINKADIGFGDYKLYDVAPNDFISLIKYSECVFTDSFHACVFSGIYNKNFYVFNRSGAKNMATRIYTLCELFECQDHFCDCDEKFDTAYIEQLNSINYDKDFTLLKEMKDKSIKFLKEALDGE